MTPRGFAFKLSSPMSELSHLDEQGRVAMVDTSAKEASVRRALASARVLMSPATVETVRAGRTPKGDPLETARIAGILAAKRVPELIPLCHPVRMNHIGVEFAKDGDDAIVITATIRGVDRTGFEIEALTAASIAADG